MLLPYRMPVLLRSSDIHLSARSIYRRDASRSAQGSYIVVGVIIAILILIVGVFTYARSRKNKGQNGGYRQTRDMEDHSRTRSRRPPPNFDAAVSEANRNNSNAAIDRNTSVRSVMTLPAYRKSANEHEQVLGREGERDGVDVVVELPSLEAEEALRDEEMETAYQIRLARRQENAEREERRRERREARSRGDTLALNQITERARTASQISVVSDLRSEHDRIRAERQRAVSSVSYADLGVARHDGTRLRANSTESERVGLLSDAASITLSTRSPLSTHRRIRSSSSVLSFDSRESVPSPGQPRSGPTTPQLGPQHTGGSSPEIIGEADLGDATLSLQSPPEYDEVSLDEPRCGATTRNFNEPPPDYPGPKRERTQRLSAHVADMVDSVGNDGDLSGRSSRSTAGLSRGQGSLPSLQTEDLPQIVIDQPSAHPDRDR